MKQEQRLRIITEKPSESIKNAFINVETALGGRHATAVLLATRHDLDLSELLLLKLMADPRWRNKPLSKLCGKAGLSLGHFLKLVSSAKGAQAMLEAQNKISAYTPQLAEDIMQRALPREEICGRCVGTGKVKAGDDAIDCMACKGAGVVPSAPELDRQELAAKVSGLLKTGGGPQATVNVGIQNTQAAPITTSPDFRAAVDRIRYPKRFADATVDAEVTQLPAETE